MKTPMTVGEMIARHHWRDRQMLARADAQMFYATDIGRALNRFENALVRLGQVEAQEHVSEHTLTVCGERVEQARDEICTLLFFKVGQDRRDRLTELPNG